ncbi:MAG: DUF3810 domain-containing protein [Ginsengibacter sp.]
MRTRRRIGNRKIWWLIAIVLVLSIKLFSLNGDAVEKYYTYGIYPVFSTISGFLLGWIPFSVGDILYVTAGIWLLYKVVKNIWLLFNRGFKKSNFFPKIADAALILVFVYIIFNLSWGLNYNRSGLVAQLGLQDVRYDTADIVAINNLLINKVNSSKKVLNSQKNPYPDTHTLFRRSRATFKEAGEKYPFLRYNKRSESVKSSMYGWLGNYLGFTGYYNPFTGEAQVNTTVPQFLRPYIVNHEVAHQLGYAKEDAASFAGYLSILYSNDTLFKYSAYLDLFTFTNREVYFIDSARAHQSYSQLDPSVIKDLEEWKEFTLAHQSFVASLSTWMYGKFLKLNEQPQGMHSYNRVIVMLAAYYKKYGVI